MPRGPVSALGVKVPTPVFTGFGFAPGLKPSVMPFLPSSREHCLTSRNPWQAMDGRWSHTRCGLGWHTLPKSRPQLGLRLSPCLCLISLGFTFSPMEVVCGSTVPFRGMQRGAAWLQGMTPTAVHRCGNEQALCLPGGSLCCNPSPLKLVKSLADLSTCGLIAKRWWCRPEPLCRADRSPPIMPMLTFGPKFNS